MLTATLTEAESGRAEAERFLTATIRDNPYIPHWPTPQQMAFLLLTGREALYGGAAGGGKSDALLMAALQFVHVPGYAAVMFRRTYTDLSLAGGLIPRSMEWLGDTDAKYNGSTHTWSFPSGATLSFSYLARDADVYRYQSSEFQSIMFDELTHFSEFQYRYMFSRNRKRVDLPVPLRVRAGSNPGGVGHEWVRRRFLDEERLFVPAKLGDNPHVDQAGYRQSLAMLDPLTRAQLLRGNWDVIPVGGLYRRDWFVPVDEVPAAARRVRFWDLAATAPAKGKDPDYTAGALLAEHNGQCWIEDIAYTKGTPAEVEELVKRTAAYDGKRVAIRMEREPGASGVTTIDTYARRHLLGYDFQGIAATGKKTERARPLASAAEQSNVFVKRGGSWVSLFLDQAQTFGIDGYHDDLPDACAGGWGYLTATLQPRAFSGAVGGQRVLGGARS